MRTIIVEKQAAKAQQLITAHANSIRETLKNAGRHDIAQRVISLYDSSARAIDHAQSQREIELIINQMADVSIIIEQLLKGGDHE